MNLAHLHLALNHIPVIGIPLALVVLVYGILRTEANVQKLALMLLSTLGVITLGVYLTGEPAEKTIEHLPGIAESLIERHEDAANISLALCLLTGLAAGASLWLAGKERAWRLAVRASLGMGILAALSLAYTANRGGEIHHQELRSGASSPDEAPREK